MTGQPKPITRRWELWAIIALFTVSGASGGFALGQLATRDQAVEEIEASRAAYHEAKESLNESLEMCLRLIPKSDATSIKTMAELQNKLTNPARSAVPK